MNLLARRHAVKLSLGAVLLALSCSTASLAQAPATAPQNQSASEYQEGAILWTQASGERNALCYQSFALARMVLDRDLRMNRRSRQRRAVVVDIDETVMDNSAFQATLLKNGQVYSAGSWTNWVNRREATAIPGAVEFLRYAASRGVRVFYITNRKQAEEGEATIANLKKLGFPDVSNETVMGRTDPNSSSKEARRQTVGSRYRIVLLMGDNLNDFAEVFDKSRTVEDRIAAVERNKQEFGTRFIVLPNPMYGDWENAVYDYNFKLTEQEKAAKRRSRLRTY